MKITVVGGASSYTPELFAGLVDFRDQLQADQVTLTDLDVGKLGLIQDVCRGVTLSAGLRTKISATPNLAEALDSADFVILQIRVGGVQARIRDETLPMELGMVGNETTGAGGFVCGLRTVPAALRIAREIERVAPRACLLNLSNPAGMVTEALLQQTPLRTIGFCNIPINTTYEIAEILGVPPDQVELCSFGLNHLSWVREVRVGGEERLKELIDGTHDLSSVLYKNGLVEDLMDPRWLRILGMIPSWYVRYYYWTEQVLAQDRTGQCTDGERDVEAEEKLRDLYVKEGYGERARRILASKGGAQYYLPVLQVIASIVHDRSQVVIVNVQNNGALPDLAADACVEVPARINRESIQPLVVGPMPVSVRGLVQTVKAYEQLTVEAATTGSHEAALTALATHPLVGSFSRACQFWERVLANERPYLPQFFGHGPELPFSR